MQLPRGRFDRFVQDGTISGIVKELGETGYSGRCSGTVEESVVEIVFDNGAIILAEFSSTNGADAVNKFNSCPEGAFSAELSFYTPSELKLASEFNPKCIVTKEVPVTVFPGTQEKRRSVERAAEKKVREPEPEVEDTAGPGDSCEIFIDESEIESIVTNFRSGARDLLKRINLDHLIINDKSGEDEDDKH